MNQDGLVQFRSGPQHNDILRLGGGLASLQLVFAVGQFQLLSMLYHLNALISSHSQSGEKEAIEFLITSRRPASTEPS